MKLLILLALSSSITFANCYISLSYDKSGSYNDMSPSLAGKLSKKIGNLLEDKGYSVVGSPHHTIDNLSLAVERRSTGGWGQTNYYSIIRQNNDGSEGQEFSSSTGMNYALQFKQKRHHVKQILDLVERNIEDCHSQD